jgi:hypothetical protein
MALPRRGARNFLAPLRGAYKEDGFRPAKNKVKVLFDFIKLHINNINTDGDFTDPMPEL